MTKTDIEWADYVSNLLKATFNDKVGYACVKHSEGCAHCWASTFNVRLGTGLDYTVPNLEKVSMYVDDAEREKLRQFKTKGPYKNGRSRPLVFPCDMTDLFGAWVPNWIIAKIFRSFVERPDLDFLILTKRPERAFAFLCEIRQLWTAFGQFPLENVFIGASIENQQRADERNITLALISKMGWKTVVSYEPALEMVDWAGWDFLDLMICGGESGPKARPMHPDWARAAREFCRSHQIPFFFKQWGEFLSTDQVEFMPAAERALVQTRLTPGRRCKSKDPLWENFFRVGNKYAGHWLDGNAWHQML